MRNERGGANTRQPSASILSNRCQTILPAHEPSDVPFFSLAPTGGEGWGEGANIRQPSAPIPSNRCQTILPLLGGPQCAKRKALTGHPSRGGLGKPLGRGEGELYTDISHLGPGGRERIGRPAVERSDHEKRDALFLPRPVRNERGEGRGEGLFSSQVLALLSSLSTRSGKKIAPTRLQSWQGVARMPGARVRDPQQRPNPQYCSNFLNPFACLSPLFHFFDLCSASSSCAQRQRSSNASLARPPRLVQGWGRLPAVRRNACWLNNHFRRGILGVGTARCSRSGVFPAPDSLMAGHRSGPFKLTLEAARNGLQSKKSFT